MLWIDRHHVDAILIWILPQVSTVHSFFNFIQGGLQAGAAADRATLLHPLGGGSFEAQAVCYPHWSPAQRAGHTAFQQTFHILKQNYGYFSYWTIVFYRIRAFIDILYCIFGLIIVLCV